MAFQKTKGRGVFVRPLVCPTFLVFPCAAEYANIAKLGMSIGTNERQREFNDAIRQAGIEGKHLALKEILTVILSLLLILNMPKPRKCILIKKRMQF